MSVYISIGKMYIQRISLVNFKNLREADIAFSSNINCFIGNNGAGKTNILDAIYYLSMCKSAFNLTDGQSVTHDADFFVIDGNYRINTDQRESISCGFKKGSGKTLKRGGKEYEKLSEHIGLLPVVLVSPSDNSLINESGEDRRRFLNTIISQIDKDYLKALIKYNHVLAERNKLLKNQYSNGFSDILSVLDMQLAEYGNVIHSKREAFIGEISPILEQYYAVLSDSGESVSVSYKSDLNGNDFAELLDRSQERDRIMQYTTSGVHRDDIRMSLDGVALRKFGSQGQQKSFLIALKLAQFEVLASNCGYRPILLLDDIFDKLDLYRVERLIRLVSQEKFGQIFITDSNKVRLEGILEGLDNEYKLFSVDKGEVKEITE